MSIAPPRSLVAEHEELRQFLAGAVREPGELGEAAQRVQRLLEPHMQREEMFALPPLGLLPALAKGAIEPSMRHAFVHTGWLKEHLEDMKAEHHMIGAAVEALLRVAAAQRRAEYVEFAQKLLNHARLEEEILYPAAILAGEFLGVRLGRGAAVAP